MTAQEEPDGPQPAAEPALDAKASAHTPTPDILGEASHHRPGEQLPKAIDFVTMAMFIIGKSRCGPGLTQPTTL